jgi:hypothetical protein
VERSPGAVQEEHIQKRDNPEKVPSNPLMAKTEKSHPSEPIYEHNGRSGKDTNEPERKSVRRELNEIRAARAVQAAAKLDPSKEQPKPIKQATNAIKHVTRAKIKNPIER